MAVSAIHMSLDRKKKVKGLATKFDRFVPHGLLFSGGGGPTEVLCMLEGEKRHGPLPYRITVSYMELQKLMSSLRGVRETNWQVHRAFIL